MEDFCGKGREEYRHAWHRYQFKLIYERWRLGLNKAEQWKSMGAFTVEQCMEGDMGGEGTSCWWQGNVLVDQKEII